MTCSRTITTILAVALLPAAWPQDGTVLVAARQTGLPTVSLVPNQVATLYVAGLRSALSAERPRERAAGLPLPTTLGGVSVSLRQSPGPGQTLPLLAVELLDRCAGPDRGLPECPVTAITVQVPPDLAVTAPLLVPLLFAATETELTIMALGQTSRRFAVQPVPDKVHLLRSCDAAGFAQPAGACLPLISRADGSLMPAHSLPGAPPVAAVREGETLVLYAYGLGATEPVVPTGQPAPADPPATAAPYLLRYDFRANTAPVPPEPAEEEVVGGIRHERPEFAGLVPGEVGLYQVRLTVPAVPPNTPACGPGVRSNLTITLAPDSSSPGQQASLDGLSLCVQVPRAEPAASGGGAP